MLKHLGCNTLTSSLSALVVKKFINLKGSKTQSLCSVRDTRDINKAVSNNTDKFPEGYIVELSKEEKQELVENFHRFNRLKHSTVMPKAVSEKGLYMLAT